MTWGNAKSEATCDRGASGLGVQVWQNIDYGGLSACPARYRYESHFADLGRPNSSTSFNDSISSNYWIANC